MNKIIVTGNLVKDMEVEVTSNDKIHGKFTIANNIGFGDNQQVNYLNCDIYGERVDALSKYLLKGVKVLIDGQLNVTNKEYEDGWKTFVNVYVKEIEILKFVNEEEKSTKQTKKLNQIKKNKR